MNDEKVFFENLKHMLGNSGDIEMDTDLLEIEGWDSFSMMAFITMAEEKYGVKLEPFTVAEAVLIEDLYCVIKDSLGSNS